MFDKIKRWRAVGQQRREIEAEMRQAQRLPPGQRVTLKFPVLHIGRVPAFDSASWTFKIWGAVANPIRLSCAQFQSYPAKR